MTGYRDALPLLGGDMFITDGGLETTLVFLHGMELPAFAAFVLLDDPHGRRILGEYFERYLEIARAHGVGFVLESPTWRANADWGAQLGYSAADLERVNQDAIELLAELRERYRVDSMPIVISGCIGPRGDGYVVSARMSAETAQNYHAAQVRTFRDTQADMVTAYTLTYAEEAVGIVRAAQAVNMPVAIGFTLETDGRLPSGQALGEAIVQVDDATGDYAAYYMINCAHPTHFETTLAGGGNWLERIRAVRANASRRSHAELDEAAELDAGNPEELGGEYRQLRERLGNLTVLGGCCGTDHRHVEAICRCVVRQE